MNQKPVIEINGVEKSFGSKCVLAGVDLQIPQGAVVGLLGTNGCGKSTLLKCLLGLLKSDSGTSSILGDDSWNLSEQTKANLGYVPQTVQLYPWMKAPQVVRYTAAFYANWDYGFTERLLIDWKIPLDNRISNLSPGELQKLGIVLSLGYLPEVLVFDEPVASLDPIARREFLKSLLDVCSDERHTVLFSTHITSDLERVASHVAILQDGKISYFDELDALKDNVKRLRITAATELPASLEIAGCLRSEVNGNQAIVAISAVSDSLVEEVKTRFDADVAVEDLNLEEIFLEMHDA